MSAPATTDLFASSLDQLEFRRILDHVAGYAASSLGSDYVLESTPFTEVPALAQEIRMVGEAREIMREEGEQIPINGIYDIRRALSLARVSGNWLGGEDIRAIYRTMQGMRTAQEFCGSRSERAAELAALTEPIYVNRILEKHISDAIDENGEVKDTASRALFDFRRDIIAKSGALRERLGRILRRVADDDLVTGEYVTLSEGRLVLPVRVEFKRKLPGIIHGESKTGSTVYLEPAEIFDMNNEIAELTFAERREVERILRTLTQEIGAVGEEIDNSLWRIALLDAVVARARYAEEFECCEPTISEDGTTLLRNARHPILALRLDDVVPMSIDLGPQTRAVIISGPNAGGKTVAVKTVGLITMMTLCGIHPPADLCTVSPARLYSDIGDRQSVENDLSTFSAHMTRVRDIIEAVEPGDIVLLDELGTGTDPDEGAAIAAAILDRLLEKRAIILATTHHSALKIFAYEREGVENAGMEFDTATLQPTYHLLIGTPGNSYAFELLGRFGFESGIIERARENLGEDRGAMTRVIEELENSLSRSRTLEVELEAERGRAAARRERLEVELETIREKRAGIVAEARAAAEKTLEQANSLIENTLREIRAGASNDAVRTMRREIEEQRRSLGSIPGLEGEEAAESTPTDRGFSRGDSVRLKEGQEVGELQSDPDEKGNVIVQFGPIRMRSHVDELVEVTGRQRRKERRSGSESHVNPQDVQSTIDIRGRYADEIVPEIERALAAALGSGLSRLEIIHGKGTGALRRATHELLKDHPHVTSFRLGAHGEGGDGVTIVEFS